MKVLNFGSLNYDYVYDVDHIVQPGETINSQGMGTFFGGKGLNQSIALAKAEPNVEKELAGKTVVKEIYVPGKLVNLAAK